MAKVKLEGLTKKFDDILAVKNLNLEVEDEEFLVLTGPSGCGKTTTLRLIAGLEDPDSGNIYIDKALMNRVAVRKRGVQMIFPSFALWPHMKVLDEKRFSNINFPLKIRKWAHDRIKGRVEDITSRVGIKSDLFSRKPQQLSEGERQKVAIGRAIVIPPKVFLMDDPMTNIDPLAKVKLREEILKVHKQLRTTTIYVTHNMEDALAMADRIAVMNEGTILQVDTPQRLYEKPQNDTVAEFSHSYMPPSGWRDRG